MLSNTISEQHIRFRYQAENVIHNAEQALTLTCSRQRQNADQVTTLAGTRQRSNVDGVSSRLSLGGSNCPPELRADSKVHSSNPSRISFNLLHSLNQLPESNTNAIDRRFSGQRFSQSNGAPTAQVNVHTDPLHNPQVLKTSALTKMEFQKD